MAAIANEIDRILQAAATRGVNPANAAILLVASTPAFHIAVGGANDPATITFTASLVGIEGTITFTGVGCTLTTADNVATLTYANLAGATATVSASVTSNGVTVTSNTCTVTKITDGAVGGDGEDGARGAGQYYASGAVWSDAAANTATPGANVLDDIVTIYNGSTFTESKRWDGAAWVVIGAIYNGSLISDASVANTKLIGMEASKVTGQLTNSQIADLAATKVSGQLTDSQLAAIAAAKITGALVNAQIADIAAVKVTGQLTDTQIADLAATKISGQLTDAQIAAIAAAKVTGQLVNSQLADLAATKITGTLTNAQIADLAAAKITGQITGTQITDSAISTPKIAAGAVVAANIAAGAIVASKIVITNNDAVNDDPTFYDPAIWFPAIESWPAGVTPIDGSSSYPVTRVLSFAPGPAIDSACRPFKIEKGAIYRYKVTIWKNSDTAGNFGINLHIPGEYYHSISLPRTGVGVPYGNAIDWASIPNDSWIQYTGTVSATYLDYLQFMFSGTITAGALKFAIEFVRASDASLIVDGAITTDKLTANAVTAAKIAAGAITAGKIAAGTIVAADIAADTITASQIAANAITATEISAEAVTASKIAAGAITAEKMSIGTGQNLLRVSTFPINTTGWVLEYNNTGLTPEFGRYPVGTYSFGETAYLYMAGTPASGTVSTMRALDAIAVEAGARYEATMYLNTHRCTAHVTISWHQVDGTYISQSDGTPIANLNNSGNQIGSYARSTVFGVAPTGAAFASVYIVTNYDGQSTPHTFFLRGYFAEAKSNQTTFSPWAPSGVTQIDGGQITADSITANQIAASAITATELAANSVVAGKIAAGTIVAADIAADTITAAQIAANAITATELSAGAVTAGKIAAGTIVADDIASNAITAAKILAGAVTAGKIAAGSIVAGDIATDAITSDKIVANAISAVKIAAGVITTDKIAANTISSGNIAASAITADKIASNIISAKHLVVSNKDAVDPDPGFYSPITWFPASGGSWPAAVVPYEDSSNPVRRVLWFNNTAALDNGGGAVFRAEKGAVYRYKVSLYKAAGISGSFSIALHNPGVIYHALSIPRTGTAQQYGNAIDWASVPDNAWTTYTGQLTVGTVEDYLQWMISGTVTGNFYIAIELVRAGDSSLIVDGAITADKVAANAITATKIAASTITADKMNVTSLSAITTNFGSVDIATGGYLKSGQTAYDTGTGFWLGSVSGVPKFSIGNSSAAHMKWDGSTLTISNAVFDSFSATALTGINSSGANGLRTYATRVAAPSGGKSPYNYNWSISYEDTNFTGGYMTITGGTTDTVSVKGDGTNTQIAGRLICIITDANNRTVTISCSVLGTHGTPP